MARPPLENAAGHREMNISFSILETLPDFVEGFQSGFLLALFHFEPKRLAESHREAGPKTATFSLHGLKSTRMRYNSDIQRYNERKSRPDLREKKWKKQATSAIYPEQ
jgi:hypothetical protein